MNLIAEHLIQGLFLFSLAFAAGALLLLLFVGLCRRLGLLRPDEDGTLMELFRNCA